MSDLLRKALAGLRTDSVKAQRKRDPKLMIAIGLAEPSMHESMESPEEEASEEEPLSLVEDEDEEEY